jgi:hypothetical protein
MAVSEMSPRGSEKLAERLAAKGAAITVEDLKATIGIPQLVDFKILRWYLKGQPPAPYELAATLEVNQSHVGQLVQTIINQPALAQGIEIFPYGIPKPDVALVNFTNVPSELG